MAVFQVVAFTPDDFERLVYVASDRHVHQSDAGMKERGSLTVGGAGHVLDPRDYPEGTRFLLMLKEAK